eukprot:m.335902 g.335902  ORF g.335902 m.335902 type:complete len:51 (-) comp17701_c0_seq1:2350-2502(-)
MTTILKEKPNMHQELYQNVEDPNVALILNGTYVHVVQMGTSAIESSETER